MIIKNNAAYLFIGDIMRYFFILIITFIYLLISFVYPSNFKVATYDVCKIFIEIIFPSIVPMYIISLIINNNKLFIKLCYKIFKRFSIFESINSPSLFVTSILIGNPSTTIIAMSKYKNKEITLNDTNLIISSSFINPLFILNSFKYVELNTTYALFFILSLLFSNIIIITRNGKHHLNIIDIKNNFSLFESINSLPSLLLNIFIISIIVNYIKILKCASKTSK